MNMFDFNDMRYMIKSLCYMLYSSFVKKIKKIKLYVTDCSLSLTDYMVENLLYVINSILDCV